MRVVQFEIPGSGRRVGVVDGDEVIDVTASNAEMSTVYAAFGAAQDAGIGFEEILERAASKSSIRLDYGSLYEAPIGGSGPFLHAPLDHEDPHKVLISGTGLTHTGSMESRDQMHSDGDEEPTTDSAKMFQMGLDGGSPSAGTRGTSPEWFYKGNGTSLIGPGEGLEKPAFALDGGEEPELVGCYIIDRNGIPRRLGFALGNEWSDHETERINYLYLAPSKLRYCSAGPELVTDFSFDELTLECAVTRDGKPIYESGTLYSGEKYMSHSLANCEDHHFKYPQHRQPGDVHLHYFGTSQLSFATRDWKFQADDEITISSEGFSRPLRNIVVDGPSDAGSVIQVVKA
jgi:hypothetical protein